MRSAADHCPLLFPQICQFDEDHLGALQQLTSLTYGNLCKACDAAAAIAQLTRLQRLRLKGPSEFRDQQLMQLRTLSRLTSLELEGGGLSRS
jgi:hypothetical protein